MNVFYIANVLNSLYVCTEKQYISQQQLILLQHLKKLKNKQIIHPALQDGS